MKIARERIVRLQSRWKIVDESSTRRRSGESL
jgi:hypothetical protein